MAEWRRRAAISLFWFGFGLGAIGPHSHRRREHHALSLARSLHSRQNVRQAGWRRASAFNILKTGCQYAGIMPLAGLVLGCWFWTMSDIAADAARAPLTSAATGAPINSASPVPQAPSVAQPTTTDAEEEAEIAELEAEVGDRDPTYLRTRAVARYDHRLLDGSASSDRLRLRFLYGFGPRQRFAVSFLQPLVQTDTPTETARGVGDAEVQFNANFFYRERFRAGVGVQTMLETSSAALLGGATTTIKPSAELAAVLAPRLELVAALYYKRSIHTSRGIPAEQFEPDFIVNARVLDATWFVEWDSFYDVIPGHLAQTLKPGVSRGLGQGRRWVASAYYAIGVNQYARKSQHRYDGGIDVTWYPWPSR